MNHADHNVVTASLEVLHQMLKHASAPMQAALVSHGDIGSLLAQTSQTTRGVYMWSFSVGICVIFLIVFDVKIEA